MWTKETLERDLRSGRAHPYSALMALSEQGEDALEELEAEPGQSWRGIGS